MHLQAAALSLCGVSEPFLTERTAIEDVHFCMQLKTAELVADTVYRPQVLNEYIHTYTCTIVRLRSITSNMHIHACIELHTQRVP